MHTDQIWLSIAEARGDMLASATDRGHTIVPDKQPIEDRGDAQYACLHRAADMLQPLHSQTKSVL